MVKEVPWAEAIRRALASSNEPMHYSDIADFVISSGLRRTVGATPASTVASILSTSIANDEDGSPFVRLSRGVYTLRREDESDQAPRTERNPDTAKAEEIDGEEMGLIRAFGIAWRRNEVHWRKPRILGQFSSGSDPVDFADQSGVYLLLDGYRVVYAGQVAAPRLGARLTEHTKDRLNARWDRFSWFGLRPVDDSGRLGDAPDTFSARILVDTIEAVLIQSFEPPLNRRAGSMDAAEYVQAIDPRIAQAQKRQLLDELSKGLG